MEKTSIPTSSAPDVIFENARGNLQVKGWDRDEVSVSAAPSSLTLEEQNDLVRADCKSDCYLRLPHGASLTVENAQGSARFKLLEDQLTIGSVRGDLLLRDVAGMSGETVFGNLRAKYISGDIMVKEVKGNLIVRGVQGHCTFEKVKGNVDFRDVEGEIKCDVMGNARLRLSMPLGKRYEISAKGNIHCRLPEDANISFDLTSGSKTIRVKLPEASQVISQKEHQLTLGSGEAVMKLSAGGGIYLSASEKWSDEEEVEHGYAPLPEDFGDQIAEQVEAQIEAQLDMMNRQLNEQIEKLSTSIGKSELSEEEIERIVEQARVSSERASVRAQEKMRRAQVKLERKLAAAQRRRELKAQAVTRRGRSRGAWSVGIPTPPTPPSEPVSEEERLMILNMLEQKKISPEEADQLLSALEGQD